MLNLFLFQSEEHSDDQLRSSWQCPVSQLDVGVWSHAQVALVISESYKVKKNLKNLIPSEEKSQTQCHSLAGYFPLFINITFYNFLNLMFPCLPPQPRTSVPDLYTIIIVTLSNFSK